MGAPAHIRALLAAGVLLALSVCPDTDARDLPPLSLPVEQHVLANGLQLHVVFVGDPEYLVTAQALRFGAPMRTDGFGERWVGGT